MQPVPWVRKCGTLEVAVVGRGSRMIGLPPPTYLYAFAFSLQRLKFDPSTLEHAPNSIGGARPRVDRTLFEANDRIQRDNRLVGESLPCPAEQRPSGPNLARSNHRQR